MDIHGQMQLSMDALLHHSPPQTDIRDLLSPRGDMTVPRTTSSHLSNATIQNHLHATGAPPRSLQQQQQQPQPNGVAPADTLMRSQAALDRAQPPGAIADFPAVQSGLFYDPPHEPPPAVRTSPSTSSHGTLASHMGSPAMHTTSQSGYSLAAALDSGADASETPLSLHLGSAPSTTSSETSHSFGQSPGFDPNQPGGADMNGTAGDAHLLAVQSVLKTYVHVYLVLSAPLN
jgi:hypothetical protein